MNAPSDRETVFALSSAAGRAGIAVIRVSGPEAGAAYRALAGRDLPPPRRATLVRLTDPASGEALDRGLSLWFPGPASATGEDVVEFHVHGGPAVIDGMIAALASCQGLRPAEAGEFTRRAFENGRMDLTAAEGVADLVAAETEAQRRQALRQSDGALAALYEEWRGRLAEILAHYEAGIDFADEDLGSDPGAGRGPDIAALGAEIAAHLDDSHRGERLRDGLYIAIIGAPNVGKSSLLNRLARREAAIVASLAGTTRDVIECHLDIAGYPVIVADTAGLRAAEGVGGEVEREGVRRALARAAGADLKLAVFEAGGEPDSATAALIDEATIVVLNKSDLAQGAPTGAAAPSPSVAGHEALAVSAKTGTGIAALLHRLETETIALLAPAPAPALTRVRHRQALEECGEALGRALEAGPGELSAEDLRLALRALGRITGRVDVEDLLDIIFRDFCIGK